MASLDKDAVADAIKRQDGISRPNVLRVLQIRASLGAAGVKKLFAMDRTTSADGRLRELFAFCGADRTGRFAGRGAQPQNLPNSGPKVKHCDPVNGCGHYYGTSAEWCPFCGAPDWAGEEQEWCPEAIDDFLAIIATRDLATVERFCGDAIAAVSGCLRGLFIAAPGQDLLCSDYSAIEGVVAALLAGEQWRIDVFRSHGKIYEMGASKITGVLFDEMMRHAGYSDLTADRWWLSKQTGDHHPTRKKIGKVSELASAFGGWIGAWINFGADKFMNEDEIKAAILAWRDASPNIVEMWGGQHRKDPNRWAFTPELFGLEGAVVQALLNPGQCFGYRGLTYGVQGGVLYCRLLSGRFLCYHDARLDPIIARNGKQEYQISYMGVDSYTKKWTRLTTYSGKLFENVVQATARDIMAFAMLNLEAAGYPIVLHVHDEIVCEVPTGTGSIEEFEAIMGRVPEWASDWPIKAAGGWRGKRYRKD
jgi:DNA polymerase